MNKSRFLNMQRKIYNNDALNWSLDHRDPVVGSYDQHNSFKDYDALLFKDIDTKDMIALEYGAGPGRNIIRFRDRFMRIDGVDIAEVNREKAKVNLNAHGVPWPNYMITGGDYIPCDCDTYNLVFSAICLQHISCHSIRFSIMKDIYRVLKPSGYFCAQMGFGGSAANFANYYENPFDTQGTNGYYDVSITDEKNLIDDLEKIGFKNYKSDISTTGPGDSQKNWIWFRAQK